MKKAMHPPNPTDSGSYGNQEETQEYISVEEQRIATMADTIAGLASTNTRSFGNPATSAMIVSLIAQLEQQLSAEKNRNDCLLDRISELQQEVTALKVQKSILDERLDAFRSVRHINSLAIFVGTLLVGAGVELSKNNFANYSYIAFAVGGLLLISGWLVTPKGAGK